MNPDPVCSQMSDPDPVQIGPDPHHCDQISWIRTYLCLLEVSMIKIYRYILDNFALFCLTLCTLGFEIRGER
jgi:hypothetical protein